MPDPITSEEIMQRANALNSQIREWRRTIHRYPELSFTENKTAELVSGVLRDLGIPHETGVAKTGVVGHIKGLEGPTVGLRADMDALPIQEENGTDFDSQRPGMMHACGHDAHTAMLMGAANILKGFADEGRLPGSIRLLFQPSEENADEEGKSGGTRMVEEGAVDGLAAVFALHAQPPLDAGKIGTIPGSILAACDMFDLDIHGIGGHGSEPQFAIDPIVLSAHVIHAVQNIISRRIDPRDPGVISLCTINGGAARTGIPESVEMSGTIRSLSEETRELLHQELERVCGVAETLGGTFELSIKRGLPVTVNDPEATRVAREALCGLLGEEKVLLSEPIMASEDFSFMLQRVPGCYLVLGVKNPSWKQVYPVHNSTFRIDENALAVGAAALTAIAIRWMEEKR